MAAGTELNLQKNFTETWSGVVNVVTEGGTTVCSILQSAKHLVRLLETFGVGAFLGACDIFVIPMEDNAGPWTITDIGFVVDIPTGKNIGVKFTLKNNSDAESSDGDYFVKVKLNHTKTN